MQKKTQFLIVLTETKANETCLPFLCSQATFEWISIMSGVTSHYNVGAKFKKNITSTLLLTKTDDLKWIERTQNWNQIVVQTIGGEYTGWFGLEANRALSHTIVHAKIRCRWKAQHVSFSQIDVNCVYLLKNRMIWKLPRMQLLRDTSIGK